MVGKRTLTFVTLAILAWAVLITGLFGYYYLRFQEYANLLREYEAVTMRVDIYIHYGNESKGIWHNKTIVPLGATLLNVTGLVADIHYTYWPGTGVLIDSIDGVANSATEEKSWFWWYWDTTNSRWMLGEVGADQRILHRGDILGWAYQSYETWPPLPPS